MKVFSALGDAGAGYPCTVSSLSVGREPLSGHLLLPSLLHSAEKFVSYQPPLSSLYPSEIPLSYPSVLHQFEPHPVRKLCPPLKIVYREFLDDKFGVHANRKLSSSSRNAVSAAYGKLAPFYDRCLDEISIIVSGK